MIDKGIRQACLFSVLLFILQILIITYLKKIANKEENRFNQTRLASAIFIVLLLFITYVSSRSRDMISMFAYNLIIGVAFVIVIASVVVLEKFIRKKEKDGKKTKDFGKSKMLSISSLFYEKNDDNIIEPKKITNMLRSGNFVLCMINCIFTSLIPFFVEIGLFSANPILVIVLIAMTVFLTEFQLFLSQKEMTLDDLNKNKLLENPEEWTKEIENKYGKEIIGYSNTTSTNKIETSTTMQNLEELSRDIINGKNILISNSSKYETKAIYYNVINKNFINEKATLIIYEDVPSVKEAQAVINSIIEEYNNELIVKVISKFENQNAQIDKDINIYLATTQDLIEANIDYEKIQTVIINNADKVIQRNSNEIYVLATTLKKINDECQYILLSLVTEALRIATRNILLIDSFKEYQINRKKEKQTLGIQVFRRKENNIKKHKSSTNYMNDLVKLGIDTDRFDVDNIEIVSKKLPILNDVERFDEIRARRNSSLTNKELNKITNRIKINCNNLFQEVAERKMFFKNDDEKNLIYSIKSYSELNNGETYLGVISSNYMLREYIISEYLKKKNNYADLDIIIPQTMQNDAKILLGSLLLQMLNTPVKEEIIIRKLKEYDKNLIFMEGYNKISIVTAINLLMEKEFNIRTDITNYLLESTDKFGKKEYMLNNNFKTKLPKDLFEKSKIILGGYEQEVTGQKGYEIYQKYIPGQVHLIENKVYKIEDIESLDINVANISAEHLRKYKQDTEINLTNLKRIEKEEEIREYSEALIKKEILFANMNVNTLGYYEFLDCTTLEEGAYTYRKLTQSQKEKTARKYYNTKVLKLEIVPKSLEMQNSMNEEIHDKLAYTLSFLLNELFESLLDENSPYIMVKAVVSNKEILKNEEVNLYRPIIDKKVDINTISIYIIEDLKISKGLLATIENEIPRILTLTKKYLNWYENILPEDDTYIKYINVNNSLMLNEIKKIIPNIFS